MKKIAKLLIVTVVLFVISGLSISVSASDADFTVIAGTLTEYTGHDTVVVIPSTLGITKIGDATFENFNTITAVTIPEGVTEIGTRSFQHCTKLASVTLPSSLLVIGISAFRNNASLKYITIPAHVTTIGDCAFEYCSSLLGIALPPSVTTVGYSAFASCTRLKAILLPSSITTLGVNIFKYSSYVTLYVTDPSAALQYAMANQLLYSTEPVDTTAPVITIGPYTKAWTHNSIKVSATVNKGILNASSKTFLWNASFTFTAINDFGVATSKTVTIKNIDKTAPKISVKSASGKTILSGASVKFAQITVTDPNLATKTLKKNAKVVRWPANGIIQTGGSYQVIATDKAGNLSTFAIKVITFVK
ncbi:MAG: leucine-rich repeat domain-containing protein [Clostridia bacterium]